MTLQCHNIVTLQCQNIVTLQCQNIATLQCHSIVTSWHYNATVLWYHDITMPQKLWQCNDMTSRHYNITKLCQWDSMGGMFVSIITSRHCDKITKLDGDTIRQYNTVSSNDEVPCSWSIAKIKWQLWQLKSSQIVCLFILCWMNLCHILSKSRSFIL